MIGLFIEYSISVFEKGLKIAYRKKYLLVFGSAQVLELCLKERVVEDTEVNGRKGWNSVYTCQW